MGGGGGMPVYHSGRLVVGGGGPGIPKADIEFGDCMVVADGMPVLVTWIDCVSVTFVEHVEELFESSVSS